MAYWDRFDNVQRRGSLGITNLEKRLRRSIRGDIPERYVLMDKEIDDVWASGGAESRYSPSYFQYYYTGQDVIVGIDGVSEEFGFLPVVSLAYNIEQQKQPVYGAFSNTYDAVMRGTRIVTGVIEISTTTVDYMTKMLSIAATARKSKLTGLYSTRPQTEDDSNIDTYWGRKKLNDPYLGPTGKHIFSSHPPFSLVVIHGVQNVSLHAGSIFGDDELVAMFADNNAMFTDINERLVDNPIDPQRRVLDACEIVKLDVQYDPSGQPLSETYQFFARDLIQ